MAWPGNEQAAVAIGCGHLRASDADRERMTSTLKAAFVQGRAMKDEFDAAASARRSPHVPTRNWPQSPPASPQARPQPGRRASRPGGR